MKTGIGARVKCGGPDDQDEDDDDADATVLIPRPSFPAAQESEHG